MVNPAKKNNVTNGSIVNKEGKSMVRGKKNNIIEYGSRMLAEGVEISNDINTTGLNNNDLVIGGSGDGGIIVTSQAKAA